MSALPETGCHVMDPPPAPSSAQSSCVFRDGFGRRLVQPDPYQADVAVEVLEFSAAVAGNAQFAKALGRRVALLAGVRHTMFAHIYRLDRPSENSLQLVSEHVGGQRLAQVLEVCDRHRLPIDIRAVLNLLRQLVPSVVLYSRRQREMAIGTIGPERLILTPHARLIVAEHSLGSAIDTLGLDRDGLWREYRVAMPEGEPQVSPRSDVLGIGVVALSLLRGRLLGDDEFPAALGDLLKQATECNGDETRPLSRGLFNWLARALQLDPEQSFESPQAAQIAFEEMLASERDYVTATAFLDAFIARQREIADTQSEQATDSSEDPAEQSLAPDALTSAERQPEQESHVDPAVVDGEAAAVATSVVSLATKRWSTRLLAGLVVLVITESIVIGWLWQQSAAALIRHGELVVQSRPMGARVMVDEDMVGRTPVTVRLAPGAYTVKVQAGLSEPRVLVLEIRAGVQTSQYLELQVEK